MRWIVVTLITVSSTLTPVTSAEPEPAMTAEDLQQLCTGEDHVSRNACRIYILGVTQGIVVGVRMAGGSSAGTPCVPPGTSADATVVKVELTVMRATTIHLIGTVSSPYSALRNRDRIPAE